MRLHVRTLEDPNNQWIGKGYLDRVDWFRVREGVGLSGDGEYDWMGRRE